MSPSDTSQKTPSTENAKPEKQQPELMINPNQLAGIESLRTKCNLPAAEDIEASNNRIVAIQWLYRLSGRTNGVYTGLWEAYLEKLAAAKENV